jgi:hypothetical protein
MRRGVGASLRDRTAASVAPPARHCWADPPGHPGPWPGLVVEWRRSDDGGWEGRCVYVIDGGDASGPRLVERWLPARCLTPVTPTA